MISVLNSRDQRARERAAKKIVQTKHKTKDVVVNIQTLQDKIKEKHEVHMAQCNHTRFHATNAHPFV